MVPAPLTGTNLMEQQADQPPSVSPETLAEIRKHDYQEAGRYFDEEMQSRRKIEVILVLTYLLTVIYAYPVQDLQTNPAIEISPLSLKIPLKYAIIISPTLIAALYLTYISSGIQQSVLERQHTYFRYLFEFPQEQIVTKEDEERFMIWLAGNISHLRFVLLPTAFQRKVSLPLSKMGRISSTAVEIFVGFVFTMAPYASVIFLVYKAWVLNKNTYILGWNGVCVAIMVSVMVTAIFATKKSRGFTYRTLFPL
jgi:hypothetical protein